MIDATPGDGAADRPRVLLVRFSALGDLVTLEPIFRAVRQLIPAHLTLLTTGLGEQLYSDTAYFDRIITRPSGLWRGICQMRRERFDLAVNLQCTHASHLLVAATRTGRVINRSRNFRQQTLKTKTHTMSQSELLLAMAAGAAAVADYMASEDALTIALPTRGTGDYGAQLRAQFGDARVVAISTGASQRWTSKHWGEDRFGELAERLLAAGHGVILVGSKLEQETAGRLCERLPRVLDFTARTSVGELKQLLAGVDLLVGNDSGPAHLAAAVGTPTVTIFGPTSPRHCVKHFPYRGAHAFLQPDAAVTCHPCYKSRCPIGLICMASIGVDAVTELAQQQLS